MTPNICLLRSLALPLACYVLTGCVLHTDLLQEGNAPEPRRHTLKEIRDYAVVKQTLDYSCGSAALATLMRYYFGDQTSEEEILSLLNARLNDTERAERLLKGFSLLDLKYAARAKGYQAEGFRVTLDDLARLAAPVIVHLEPLDYKHFAVLRGIDRGRVYLADPARGNLRMSMGRFHEEWTGVIFVLGKNGEEQIQHYPLELPRPTHLQPEVLRVLPSTELGIFEQNLSIRGGMR
jgi:hypothetical protein